MSATDMQLMLIRPGDREKFLPPPPLLPARPPPAPSAGLHGLIEAASNLGTGTDGGVCA